MSNLHHVILPVVIAARKKDWGKAATILRELLQEATIADILEAKRKEEAEEIADQGEATYSTCYKESLDKDSKSSCQVPRQVSTPS